jgi:hypothetical protein
MLALLAAFLVAPQQTSQNLVAELQDPNTGESNVEVIQRAARLDTPKLSPQALKGVHWEFDWLTSTYAGITGTGQKDLRFCVYSQERGPGMDTAMRVAIMDGRMWQLLHQKYKFDHPEIENGLRLVDEYLCWGGTAGGEQEMGEDIDNGHVRRANTIYIYDIASFKNPMEMAREVAHEYGHAVLPAVGGFETPEDWANGYLGERLFLRWLRDSFEQGRINSGGVMGASFQQLDAWVHQNVDPLVTDVALHGPNMALLKSKGQKAMNAYMGLVLYADSILPSRMVARSMKLTGSTSAKDYPDAIVQAASEGSYTVNVPNYLYGKKLWLPLGKSQVKGGKVLVRTGSWAAVQPTGASMVVLTPNS